jgi:hypothetical protein
MTDINANTETNREKSDVSCHTLHSVDEIERAHHASVKWLIMSTDAIACMNAATLCSCSTARAAASASSRLLHSTMSMKRSGILASRRTERRRKPARVARKAYMDADAAARPARALSCTV